MGVYYKFVCDKRRERIEPGEIGTSTNPDGGGIKEGPVIFSDVSRVVACFAIHGLWAGESFRIVSDSRGGAYDDETLADVTEKAVNLYNERVEKSPFPRTVFIPE